ncbi:class I SAM-dependent methyltransferase [Aquimarina sp. RZ0]|uniref:class I SAM-dependent methyltransferase n=1 Tax=Aquimarina sp. RZ0 TaxID=2607730 RepID=UPI0011F13460|nr:class I SAM-dependent methyltransferase [Aquimarina sp. RZ0]KAA1242986.1 adenosine deaminase [Aquimarina sp. RZ0]
MQIHETAFIVSTYRSYHQELSKDIYARLWNNPNTDLLIPSILESISKDEAILHSLRNRFFYEQMYAFFSKNNGGTLINFGAGFSMYPFLLNNTVDTIEIDKKDIIAYKKEKTMHWIREGKLPQRDIQYTAIDFNNSSEQDIHTTIQPMIHKTPTFILLEGVLFFLGPDTTHKLWNIFKEIQSKGDLVGSVSYIPEIENTDVYKRLLHYFDTHNDTDDPFYHQTLPHSFYENLDRYQLKKHIDEFDLSKIYAPDAEIRDRTQILNEHMYILQKS